VYRGGEEGKARERKEGGGRGKRVASFFPLSHPRYTFASCPKVGALSVSRSLPALSSEKRKEKGEKGVKRFLRYPGFEFVSLYSPRPPKFPRHPCFKGGKKGEKEKERGGGETSHLNLP